MSLQAVLNSVRMEPAQCAGILGISEDIFREWIGGNKFIPGSVVNLLSAVLGVSPDTIRSEGSETSSSDPPALWFKLRSADLVDADRESVLLARQLGHYTNQLDDISGVPGNEWRVIYEMIRRNTDFESPPADQGKAAARQLRSMRGLQKGAIGIGETFRGNLRSTGLLILESPLPESRVEGCSFFVGSKERARPCIFANTHHGTWFRRNYVLAHELGHTMFDAESNGISLDLVAGSGEEELTERRADAFAQEFLVPAEVLHHAGQVNGIQWHGVSREQLAVLVAALHVEQRIILRAAVDYGVITPEQRDEYGAFDIGGLLSQLTDRALSTRAFFAKHREVGMPWVGKRSTTIPSRRFMLPAGYVARVVAEVSNDRITAGKAAELLMISKQEFIKRFSDVLPEHAD